VGAGAEEVGAEVGHVLVHAAEAVDAVDDEEDAVLGVALLVELGNGAGDGADGEPDARLRMHPGDAHHPGRGLHAIADAADDLVDGGLRGIVEEGNLAERRAGALGGVLDRQVMRGVVVVGGEDLLPGLEREAVVDEREAGGGVRGEADLFRLAAEIGGGGLADAALDVLRLVLEEPAVDDHERVLVHGLAPGLDRVADRGGVGGDEEAGEVEVLGREPEEAADLAPVVDCRGGWGGGLEGGEEASGNEDGAGGGPLSGEKRTSGEGHLDLRGDSRNAQHTPQAAHCLTCREVRGAPRA
jgi:hypothetical protein